MTDKGTKEFDRLLWRYAKIETKLVEFDRQCTDIISVSPLGQAPPVFHRLVRRELDVLEDELAPLWDEIRCRIVPDSNFKTLWQLIKGWTPGTLPPRFPELVDALGKIESRSPLQARQHRGAGLR